nr:MAG TPA_asm: hypothetical protein [Caudoviricetes sp.]
MSMNDDKKTIVVGMLNSPPYDRMYDMSRRIHSPGGISPTINTFGGGNQEIKILITYD